MSVIGILEILWECGLEIGYVPDSLPHCNIVKN